MNIRDQIAIIQRERSQQFQRPYFPTPQILSTITVSTSGNNMALAYGSLRGLYYDTSGTALTPAAPLATAYNPAAPVAITDKGIAYATLTSSTGGTTNVLLVNRQIKNGSGTILYNPVLTFDIPASCTVLAYRIIPVPAPAATFIYAYEAYWA